ncbi:ParB/RepB/Spo0J family partition protein [Ethanoligenens sp.]|uniref:ParB/RepB/Spo0J family partition protein n=1 Tax=Ethanoligenens sp. TaxID=2099655 RepID=UPI0039EC367D
MGKFSVDDIMESAQKIAEKAEGLEPVPEFKEIRCSLVDFNPENVFAKKDTDETIAELADDIETNGLLHPIVVNHVGGRYRLISGERRFKAITSVLQWQVIQANVYEGLDQFGEIKRLYAANYQVRQYTAAESLSHYQHLTQLLFDKSHDDAISTKQKKKIAEMLNVSGRQVNKYARICQDLSADELQAIAENRMSINQADALAGSRMETPKKPSSALHKQEPVPKQQQKVSSVGSQKITEVSAHTSPLPSSPLLEKQELVPEKANQESVPVPPVPIPHDTLGFNESTAADVVRQIEEITTGLYLLSDMLKKSGVDMGNTIDKFIETMHEYQHEYHDQVNAGK